MTGCSTLTGGDAAALDEARTALDRIAASDAPDLVAALALACHRDRLADRNARMPAGLPAVWAALGQLPRALALARSITHSWGQAEALAEIAAALAQAGQHQQAEDIAAQAEEVARSDANHWVLPVVALTVARAGQYKQAEDIARSIDSSHSRVRALTDVAAALAQAGQHQQAEDIARSITDGWPQAEALAKVAAALAQAGQHQQAEDIARSIYAPYNKAEALADVAAALATAGTAPAS